MIGEREFVIDVLLLPEMSRAERAGRAKKMNNSHCPVLRWRRRCKAAPSGRFWRSIIVATLKGKVWSIARFRLYPASRVSGLGPAGLGKPKLLLDLPAGIVNRCTGRGYLVRTGMYQYRKNILVHTGTYQYALSMYHNNDVIWNPDFRYIYHAYTWYKPCICRCPTYTCNIHGISINIPCISIQVDIHGISMDIPCI
jgi:hypothetical protein